MEAFVLVLFGATGDLAKLKILPAIYELKKRRLLPNQFSLVGNGRSSLDTEGFRKYAMSVWEEKFGERLEKKVCDDLLEQTFYFQGDLADSKMYEGLNDFLRGLRKEGISCDNRVFHLAILPQLYQQVAELLGSSGLTGPDCGWVRVLLEKPFGTDLESAQVLDACLKRHFSEDQIYRIDHYLAKETVQNILYFRFANEMFEPTFNNKYIDHIQITMMEEFGIKDRGKFYERTGALKDVVQNHVLQVLATVTMDRPTEIASEFLRPKRQELLRQLERPSLDSVVVGQYDGYRQEKGVGADSKTETFIALKAEIGSDRWKGVPVYVRHGKGLCRTVSEVNVVYKDQSMKPSPNVLTFRLSPHESIVLRFFVTKPGPTTELQQANLQFHYHQLKEQLMEAYQKVLLDAFGGSQTLFTMAEGVEAEWRFVDPILKDWENKKSGPIVYRQGSWGPREADEMIKRDGREWIEPSVDLEIDS